MENEYRKKMWIAQRELDKKDTEIDMKDRQIGDLEHSVRVYKDEADSLRRQLSSSTSSGPAYKPNFNRPTYCG